MSLFRSVLSISTLLNVARRQRADEETRKKRFYLAVHSIVYSLLAVGFAAGAGALLGLLGGIDGRGVIWLCCAIFGAVLAIGVLVELAMSIFACVLQFSVTRNAASWIALVVLILSAIGAAVLVWLFLGNV